MKGKKRKILGVFALAIVVCFLLVVLFLDYTIKSSVNVFLPKLTKTEAYLEDVDISLLRGRVELNGLTIGNPANYSKGNALSVGTVLVDVDVVSLFTNKIVVEDITLRGLEVWYEKKNLGGSNIKTLLANMQSPTDTEEDPPAEEESTQEQDSGKKLEISHLLVAEGKLKMSFAGTKGVGIAVALPQIEMRDIGKDSEGESLDKIFQQVFQQIFTQADKAFVQNLPLLKDTMKSAGETLKSTGKKLQEDAEGLFKGIKGIFDK